jgi:hypothetical protein
MIAVPTVTPVTTPDVLTVATDGLLLLQTPPGVMHVYVVEVPAQTDDAPITESTEGVPVTVTTAVLLQPVESV